MRLALLENARKLPPAMKSQEPEKTGTLVDVAKALKTAKDDDDKDKKKGISLSGLLNAIDGVASHEGRVLVMT